MRTCSHIYTCSHMHTCSHTHVHMRVCAHRGTHLQATVFSIPCHTCLCSIIPETVLLTNPFCYLPLCFLLWAEHPSCASRPYSSPAPAWDKEETKASLGAAHLGQGLGDIWGNDVFLKTRSEAWPSEVHVAAATEKSEQRWCVG